jgi:hypothetical protein
LGVLALAIAQALWAQYAPAPNTYSVTQINSMMGGPMPMEIHRDGSKAVVDNTGSHVRSFYDLASHTQHSWDIQHPENGCSAGTFSGDWGDPFQSSDVDGILKQATAPPGSETVAGFATKVIEATDGASHIKLKVWRETKYGLIVKADMTQPGAPAATILETKAFTTAKPDAALFVLPKNCGAPPPTAEQRFAGETGEDAANLVDATMGPGSANSCTMLMRFVRAGSLQPLTDFQVALDLQFDVNNPPHYVMGGSASGKTVFSGGHLKEYTAQMQNGILRIDNVPQVFDVEVTFAGGNKGAGSATLYRKCAGPQTVLLYMVKNPDKLSDGADWVWVKSGKLATVPGH